MGAKLGVFDVTRSPAGWFDATLVNGASWFDETIAQAFQLSPDTGAFALSGTTTGLTKQSKIVAAAGSFSESGQAVTPAVAIAAALGNFVENGQAATFAVTMPASVGVFAESSPASAFAIGMPAAAGSFADTGIAATLRKASILACAQGPFADTGEPAAFAIALPAASGPFALSGQDVALRALMPAAFGSFAETGTAVHFDVRMPAGVGMFGDTGEDVALVFTPIQSATLAALRGAVALAGEPASLLAGRLQTAARASFTLLGEPAVFDDALFVVAGAFSGSGQAAGLIASRFFAADAVFLALSGIDAGLARVHGFLVGVVPTTGDVVQLTIGASVVQRGATAAAANRDVPSSSIVFVPSSAATSFGPTTE